MEEAGIEADYKSSFIDESHPGRSPVNVFTDSSALAKRYIVDEASSDMDDLLAGASSLAVSILCVTEIISALCRRRRERVLKPAEYAAARKALEADLSDATVIQITDEVVIQSVRLLESHPLRSSDAIQLSSALVWRADRFLSADVRQCSAARAAGLKVIQL